MKAETLSEGYPCSFKNPEFCGLINDKVFVLLASDGCFDWERFCSKMMLQFHTVVFTSLSQETSVGTKTHWR